jgi:transcriptional regulator with XRE-family HTH domain
MSTMFGVKLKTLRAEKQIPQRKLASILGIDTATYCKIEKGSRLAKRSQVIILAKSLQTDSKEFIRLWSADKVYKILAEEDEATQILNVVAESLVSSKRKKTKQ